MEVLWKHDVVQILMAIQDDQQVEEPEILSKIQKEWNVLLTRCVFSFMYMGGYTFVRVSKYNWKSPRK